MSKIVEIKGKYYDFSPRNQSFLQTAEELKCLGIKNYYFMLRVIDPRSVNIDPFKPNITRQEVALLMTEYIHNMWAFMRDAVRVRTQKGVVPYYLHRGLCAGAYCFSINQDFCLCEPRQTFKTTELIGGPIQWAFQTSRNLKMHFYGQKIENTRDNLDHLRDDIKLLPKWMQFNKFVNEDGKIDKTNESDNGIKNKLTGNSLVIHSEPTTATKAEKIGRGQSGAVLMFDEVGHTPNIDIVWANSTPLFQTAHEAALEIGLPTCRVCTCTPPNTDTKIGRQSYDLLKTMIPWTEKIYDMTPEEVQAYKDTFYDEYHKMADSPDKDVIDVFYMEYQYFQIRKTYDWVLEQFKRGGDKRTIRRDILLQNIRGVDDSFLEPEDIDYLVSNLKRPINELLIDRKWIVKLYDHGAKSLFQEDNPFDKSIPYLIGIDPAGGASGKRGDYFAVTIINPNNMEIAGEFHSQFMGEPDAIRFIQELVLKYIPKGVLIIEKNAMGIYLIEMLAESNLVKNMYWSQKGAEKELENLSYENSGQLRKMSNKYGKYGTQLTKPVRDAMFELLKMHAKECIDKLRTEYLVNDLSKLVYNNGKPQADKGEHDDSLMSYLHAIYVYYTGDNLKFFGIQKKFYPSYKEEDIANDEEEVFVSTIFESMGVGVKKKEPTFEDEYIRQLNEERAKTQELVDRLPFVESLGYAPNKSDTPLGEELVDIDASFFDQINGI